MESNRKFRAARIIKVVKRILRGAVWRLAALVDALKRHWMVLTGRTIVPTHEYGQYQHYVAHQKEKTCDKERIAKWQGAEWQIKLDGFRDIYSRNWEFLEGKESALCLGSRTGQEVKALWDLGIQAVGVDLVPFPPYTIEGDVHDLPYEDRTFDFVFSNIFDHVLYPEKFCQEIERVTAPSGVVILHLQLGIRGDEYTETVIYDPAHVVAMFKQHDLVESRKSRNTFDEMNWEIVLQKRKLAGNG